MAISAISVVAPHCDIEERLALVPQTAMIRGLWFRAITDELERRGLMARYTEAFPGKRESLMQHYPVAEYLPRLAFAGALLTSPERVHEGMYELSLGNARYFSGSLIGRGLRHLVTGRDPIKLAEQAVSSKRHITNYGRWSVGTRSANHVEVVLEDEYVWMDSALLGAATGTFEVIPGSTTTAEVRSRFAGSIIARW